MISVVVLNRIEWKEFNNAWRNDEPLTRLYRAIASRMLRIWCLVYFGKPGRDAIKWSRGGVTGSIQSFVEREVQEHLQINPTLRRRTRSLHLRTLRKALANRKFGELVRKYIWLCGFVIFLEIFFFSWSQMLNFEGFARHILEEFSDLTKDLSFVDVWLISLKEKLSIEENYSQLIFDMSSFFATIQVGALGIVSIAVALVTLITQREGANTDVQIYYHEALVFEIIASSIALLTILCAQIIWPMHLIVSWIYSGAPLQYSKLIMLGIHLIWLLVNLAALVQFLATTFGFMQQSLRERIREAFTANVVIPSDLRQRFCGQLLNIASNEFSDERGLGDMRQYPMTFFGHDLQDQSDAVEIEQNFHHAKVLYDVRIRVAGVALRSWARRCDSATTDEDSVAQKAYSHRRPVLMFTPRFEQHLRGHTSWCVRRGGFRLKKWERLLLRLAFRFRRVQNEV